MAKESTVVKKKSMSWAESKEAGTEAGQGRGQLLSVDWLTKSSPGNGMKVFSRRSLLVSEATYELKPKECP